MNSTQFSVPLPQRLFHGTQSRQILCLVGSICLSVTSLFSFSVCPHKVALKNASHHRLTAVKTEDAELFVGGSTIVLCGGLQIAHELGTSAAADWEYCFNWTSGIISANVSGTPAAGAMSSIPFLSFITFCNMKTLQRWPTSRVYVIVVFAILMLFDIMSIRLAVKALTNRQTHTQTQGTDSITSTANVGGNNSLSTI